MTKSLAIVLLTVVCVIGCDKIDKVVTRLDRAIAEVSRLRHDLKEESVNWRESVFELESKLKSDVSDIITEDLKALADSTIDSAGQEFRCNVGFIEDKLDRYLQQLENELVAKRAAIVGGTSDESPDEAVVSAVEAVGRMPAHLCTVRPDEVRINHTNNESEPSAFAAATPTVSGTRSKGTGVNSRKRPPSPLIFPMLHAPVKASAADPTGGSWPPDESTKRGSIRTDTVVEYRRPTGWTQRAGKPVRLFYQNVLTRPSMEEEVEEEEAREVDSLAVLSNHPETVSADRVEVQAVEEEEGRCLSSTLTLGRN